MMKKFLAPRYLAALAAVAFIPQACAQMFLNATLTGSFPSDSTFGGITLGADTPFTLTATFDSAVDLLPSFIGAGIFPITAYTVTLDGHGTYAGIPDADTNVILLGKQVFGSYGVGFSNADTSKAFYQTFSDSSTPTFNADAPTPSVFSNYGVTGITVYDLQFVGVPGGLEFSHLAGVPTASITTVPEPAETVAAIGLGLGAFAFLRHSCKN